MRPRRRPSITSASPTSSPISRSRPTARRSRSSCAARCSRVRRRMAATPSASPHAGTRVRRGLGAGQPPAVLRVGARCEEQPRRVRFCNARPKPSSPAAVDEFGAPVVSPDGKSIAYVNARRELRVFRSIRSNRGLSPTGEFLAGFEATNPIEWSPNSEWIAFLSRGARGFYNVNVVAAAAEKPGTDAGGQLSRQLQHRLARVVARWDVPDLRHRPAHRAGPGRASRPRPADAEVPRGSIPIVVRTGNAQAQTRARRRHRNAPAARAACQPLRRPRSCSRTFASD